MMEHRASPPRLDVRDALRSIVLERKGTMIEASVNWVDKERYVGSATSGHSIVMDTASEKTAKIAYSIEYVS